MQLLINGKPATEKNIKDEFDAAAMRGAQEAFEEKVSQIIDPDTGKPPKVKVLGTLKNMKLQISCSEEIMDQVKQLLSED